MKVLVTGGAGYIGSVAVEQLLDRGDDVAVLDNCWRGHAESVPSAVEFLRVDLRDPERVGKAVAHARPDAVLHFGAATIVPESVTDPGLYFATNLGGSINLLNAMVANDVRKFVFSSTAAVYGEPATNPILESAPANPINPYGATKLMVEQLLPWYEAAHGLRSVIFRYFNVSGATTMRGEDHNPETHVIPVALQVAAGKRPTFRLFGTDYPTPDGTAIRDYIHVSDLVDAHLLALDRLDTSLGVFNLGGREGISVQQIVDAVTRITGRQIAVARDPRRAGDPAVLVADATRARTVLGWNPTRSTLDEMIGSAWNWMRFYPRGYAGF